MKRITLLLLTALSALFVYADDELTGKVTEQTKATEGLATGQWYSLYNGSAFLKDNGDGTLGTSSTPAGHLSSDYEGVFIQLESAGDGTFYLKTYLGNYIGSLSSGAATTTGSTKAAYTVTQTESGWAFGNSGLYLDSSLSGSSSTASWTAYEVTFNSESELTAAQRLTFQKNLYNSGDPVPFRFYARRSSSSYLCYLTSTTSGSANAAKLTSSTDLSQIWLVTKSGSGYTFMNAETGEFLTGTFSTPGSETVLYMQQSPNNEDDGYYYNIASDSDFGSCMNLSNVNYSDLLVWGADIGSDWAMEYVYEVSLDEILEHLDESNIYASEVEEGVYYRIISDAYSLAMTEANNEVKCLTVDESNIAQYWTLEKNGSGWNFKNVLTGNYIQVQNSYSNTYTTASSPYAFYIEDAGDTWKNTFTIANSNGEGNGMHCASSQGYYVVKWYTSADASKWLFLETELNEDDILAAQEAQQKFEDMKSNLSSIQTSLNNLFSDKACTTLKSDIASLTDDELAANADYASLPEMIQETVLKVKNDTWTLPTNTSTVTDSYEKFFRIANYKVYSHYTQMAYSEQGQSNCFGKLSGPTGIFVNSGEVLCIYVDEDASSDCTLQVELVSTEGVPGGHQTGATTDLTAGLNLIQASEQDMVYIFYQLNNTSKYIADYPDIKIHIEGGTLNGYFDATRGMTNQDWSNLKNHDLLNVCPVINLKTDHLVFAMDADLVLSAITAAHKSTGDVQEDVEKLLRIWDMIPANEESYQGLDDFDGRFRNVWNCFSVNYNYMFATSYGTYYENSTLASVMNYYSMTHQGEGNGGGSLWGPSHEMGHNHQSLINMIGTTESSNNLFSNINFFEQGVSVTRGPSAQANFDNYLAAGSSWLDRDIWTTTRMFMQLYLYFHVMENDT
ncbi:MAG: M60 family metallopeptidase, partial [Prevotellaceae bacterium]|nr:M60 family metallopeptidase [Prevotellaceae bacterium]